MNVTIKTFYIASNGEKESRNVTLWLNRDNTVSLLGGLNHGTEIVIDQKLIDDLQELVKTIELSKEN